MTFDYALETLLVRRLVEFEAQRIATDYAQQVSFGLRLPRERVEEFRQMFANLTAGQGHLGGDIETGECA